MEQFNTIPTSGNWADIAGILDANFLRCYTALVQSQSLIGLDGSNYKGMYTSASALPDDMTEAGWALVGSSLSALQLYVFNDGATDWALFSNETYNFTSWTEFQTQLDALSTQVATIGLNVVYYAVDGARTYSITNRLTNCSTNNSRTSAALNAAYSATITANAGYTIGTVSVTMGGTDITSSVYSNGVISIANIIGDVVITATANADSQAGLFDNATWFNGFWSINTSSGTATKSTSSSYLGTLFFGVPSANYTISPKTISGYLVGFRFYLCHSVNGDTAVDVSKSSAYGKISGAVAESVNTDTIKAVDSSAPYFAISIWAKSSSGSGNLNLANKTFDELITVTRN